MKVETPAYKWNFSQIFSNCPEDFYLILNQSFLFFLNFSLKYTVFYKHLLELIFRHTGINF